MSVAARRTVPLESFLARLPEEDAASARAAAREIDALERQVGPPGPLERHLAALGLGTLFLFALGVALLIGRAAGMFERVGLAVIVPLLAVFPVLVFAYLWSVRGRTRLDREKIELNEQHFLPHGAAYFGTRDGTRTVVLAELRERDAPTLKEKAHALHAEATRRRWWW